MRKFLLALAALVFATAAYANVDLMALTPLVPFEQVAALTKFESTHQSAESNGVVILTAKTSAQEVCQFGDAQLPGMQYLFAQAQGQDTALFVGWQGMWAFKNQQEALDSPAFALLKDTLTARAQGTGKEGEFVDDRWTYQLAVGQLQDGRGALIFSAQARTAQ